MPGSDYHQISDVLHVVEQIDPLTVLEIGVGFGKWGVLCREVLEVYRGRLHRSDWKVRLEGIEIYEPYRNPLWTAAYDRVLIGDAGSVITTLGRYDLILCCDVIEHFTKEAARPLLDLMLDRSDFLILTSPRGYQPQGASLGNEFETHLSGWSAEDFDNVPHLYKDIGFTFLVVLSRDPAKIEKISLFDSLEVLGAKGALRNATKLAMRRGRRRVASLLGKGE